MYKLIDVGRVGLCGLCGLVGRGGGAAAGRGGALGGLGGLRGLGLVRIGCGGRCASASPRCGGGRGGRCVRRGGPLHLLSRSRH